jgi:hypothetical protein
MPKHEPSEHAELPLVFYSPPVSVPQGDGSVLVKPGKPLSRLSVAQFSTRVGLSSDAIYKQLGTDSIPEDFLEYSGARRVWIKAEAIEHYLAYWKARRGLAGMGRP